MESTVLQEFTDQDHEQFSEQGYLRLGKVFDQTEALQQRIDDIMLGKISCETMQFQLDGATGEYEKLAPNTPGHKGATLAYRRITGLEQDPLFLTYMQYPLFRQITRRYIGEDVSIFRAMFMNKPAHQGTKLPWHQDVGKGWGVDTTPTITVWTALDDATLENACMQLVPGSHKLGILNEGHYTSEEDQAKHILPEDIIDLEAKAGEAILLNNLTLHRSDVNPTDLPRRALSVAYMDGKTRSLKNGALYPMIFGHRALSPEAA